MQTVRHNKAIHQPDEVEILYETEDFLVIEKPSGLLSVPGREGPLQDCVINRLKPIYPTALIVHRLDMDTSGLMIIALKKNVQTEFSQLFQQRKIEKYYVADVWGQPLTNGAINLPIRANKSDPPRQLICYQYGKPSLTYFEKCLDLPLSSMTTRLVLRPHTGRRHQLRIHLATIGHPILGCDLYAHSTAHIAAKRLHLHAHRLVFNCPHTGETVSIESPRIPFETPLQGINHRA